MQIAALPAAVWNQGPLLMLCSVLLSLLLMLRPVLLTITYPLLLCVPLQLKIVNEQTTALGGGVTTTSGTSSTANAYQSF